MKPELRKRFVDSIEYLRKMDFFKDYSNLSSEEILEKISSGEIEYSTMWFDERKGDKEFLEWVKERRGEKRTNGQLLKKSIEENEDYWMKKSDFEVDLEVAPFDRKRVFIEEVETIGPPEGVPKGMGICLLKKLARISRGVFRPVDMSEEWCEWTGEVPPEARKYVYSIYDDWTQCRVSFSFKGERCAVAFYCRRDYLIIAPAVDRINGLIKDTGYQYYYVPNEYEYYIVLTPSEAEKLKKERGWKLPT